MNIFLIPLWLLFKWRMQQHRDSSLFFPEPTVYHYSGELGECALNDNKASGVYMVRESDGLLSSYSEAGSSSAGW